MTTHKSDHKVDVAMEHKKSQKDIFKLTVTLSHGQRIQVGKYTFSEQGTSISGFQFFKSAGRGFSLEVMAACHRLHPCQFSAEQL